MLSDTRKLVCKRTEGHPVLAAVRVIEGDHVAALVPQHIHQPGLPVPVDQHGVVVTLHKLGTNVPPR